MFPARELQLLYEGVDQLEAIARQERHQAQRALLYLPVRIDQVVQGCHFAHARLAALQFGGAETPWELYLRLEYLAWFASMALFVMPLSPALWVAATLLQLAAQIAAIPEGRLNRAPANGSPSVLPATPVQLATIARTAEERGHDDGRPGAWGLARRLVLEEGRAEASASARLFKAGGFRFVADGVADYVRATIKGAGPVPRIPPLRLCRGDHARRPRQRGGATVAASRRRSASRPNPGDWR